MATSHYQTASPKALLGAEGHRVCGKPLLQVEHSVGVLAPVAHDFEGDLARIDGSVDDRYLHLDGFDVVIDVHLDVFHGAALALVRGFCVDLNED